MKKKILLIILLNLSNLVYCQENTSDLKYREETKLVIDYILKNFLQESYLSILQTADKVDVNDCNTTYDSPILYNYEKEYVRECIKNPKIINWTNEFFPNNKIVDQKSQGGTIARFSSPIFLRNYELVIIKFSINSSSLSGYGFEAIFIRNNNWEMHSCSWDN